MTAFAARKISSSVYPAKVTEQKEVTDSKERTVHSGNKGSLVQLSTLFIFRYYSQHNKIGK